MLEVTNGFQSAIVGDVRQMFIKAMLELIDPDIVYQASNGSGAAPWSKSEQLYNKTFEKDRRYATLEPGRWLLDKTAVLIPDDPATVTGEVAHVGDEMCGEDGVFASEVYAELKFANVSILQACSIYFSTDPVDGVPVDFQVSILSGENVVYTKEYTGNTATSVSVDGFTVYDPTAIRVYVTKWSIGRRRIRVTEIIPGLYEEWTDDVLASLDVQMRGNFACLALPYGVCTLSMDNLDRRFEPRNKSGIFKSIEERQGIPIALGVKLADGSTEWKQLGVFYQANGGWKTGDNAMTMRWELVDIVGLIAEREFIAPATLPTTLSGWVAAVVAQLGVNFENKWHVDPNYADVSVTVNSVDDVNGKRCGDILRWACMASGTWPRADAETGYLTAEPLWSQGNKMDLDNMTIYPVMKANDDLAALIFKLYDGNDTTFVVSGNATSSSKTLTVSNPFIHTEAQALTASRQILSQYGGIKLETIGRGNPSSEIGDVDTVWLNESNATTGRRMEQSFTFVDGYLRDCRSVLLQADGSFMFEERRVLVGSGKFHIPAGVSEVRVLLVSGGQGSSKGQDGYFKSGSNLPGGSVSSGEGARGLDGSGGYVWAGVINVNPDTDYEYACGVGGKKSNKYGVAGELGTHTTFGVYSSENGEVYPVGYTDLANGDSFGRTGVAKPVDGTGDGAAGGEGGEAGVGYYEQKYWTQADVDAGKHPGATTGPSGGNRPVSPGTPGSESIVGKPKGWDFVVVKEPGPGKPGVDGADGCVVIYWDKEVEA